MAQTKKTLINEELQKAWSKICYCCSCSDVDYPTKELDMISDVLIAYEELQAISDKTAINTVGTTCGRIQTICQKIILPYSFASKDLREEKQAWKSHYTTARMDCGARQVQSLRMKM